VAAPPSPRKPRKQPVQARARHTVEAIFEACVQVLLASGPERLTTTRVAERAGVSVGTLYQYFPDKQSLLAAVLERHLLRVVEAVETACAEAAGRSTETIARASVGAFFDAKFAEPETSAALYAVAAELGGAAVVQRLTRRTQQVLAHTLAGASDGPPLDAGLAAFVLATAVAGPVQALLAARAPRAHRAAVRAQLVAMACAYLRDRAVAGGATA